MDRRARAGRGGGSALRARAARIRATVSRCPARRARRGAARARRRRRARARRAAGTVASRCCTARLPPASDARRGARPQRRSAARAGHAARRLRAAAGARPRRRRRGARRVVQAAGRRPLSRARRRDLARAPARRTRRARQRDAVARDLAARARRALSPPRPSRLAPIRARRCRASRFVPHRAAAGAGRHRRRRCATRSRRASRAASSRCVFVNRRGFAPSLICAVVQVGGAMPALQRAADRRIACRRRCAAITAATSSACRARVRRAATSTWCRSGFGTQRLERALAAAFPAARIARVDRDSTRARHAFASGPRPGRGATRSTSSSARRCSRRVTTFRASRWSACWAPTTRSTAPTSARPSGSPRCSMQVAGRAGRAGLPGEVIVQTDFPEHPVYAALGGARLRRASPTRCSPSARRAAAAVHARRACSRPRRIGATTSTRSSPPRTRMGTALAASAPATSTCSRRCRRCSRGAPGSSAASSSCRASGARALQRFLPRLARGARGDSGPPRALGDRRGPGRVRLTPPAIILRVCSRCLRRVRT